MGKARSHQFKITLDDSKPSIWRHIQLPSDAMGWEDAHPIVSITAFTRRNRDEWLTPSSHDMS